MADERAKSAPSNSPESEWTAQRRALSREIHDDVAHSILVVLGVLERVELHQEAWNPATSRLFSDAKEAATSALETVRGLAARLRGLPDDYEAPVQGKASADLPTELFCILREAVFNTLLHSRARHIVVDIERNPYRITAVVEDDGNGFEPEKLAPGAGLGLLSMHERTALIGGQLEIDSARRQGTIVKVSVPCQDTLIGDQ